MDVSLLQRVVKFHIGSAVLRIVVVGAVLAAALASWQSPSGAGFDRYLVSIEAVFLWQRVLFGLAGPDRPRLADVGDGQDPVDAVCDRHPLRRLLHGHRRRGAGQVPPRAAAGAAVKLTFVCPDCGSRLPVGAADAPGSRRLRPVPPDHDAGGEREAPRRHRGRPLPGLRRREDFYLRKDFNPQLGLTVIIAGALVSAGFYWYGRDLIAYGVLGAAALRRPRRLRPPARTSPSATGATRSSAGRIAGPRPSSTCTRRTSWSWNGPAGSGRAVRRDGTLRTPRPAPRRPDGAAGDPLAALRPARRDRRGRPRPARPPRSRLSAAGSPRSRRPATCS